MSISDLKSKIASVVHGGYGSEISLVKKVESVSGSFRSMPTIISRDARIEGDIVSSGIIEIEGNIKGNIKGNVVVLREGSYVEGLIVAESLNIRGKFDGNLKVKNLSIFNKAKVTGIIEYFSLAVDDGASVEGQFKKIS